MKLSGKLLIGAAVAAGLVGAYAAGARAQDELVARLAPGVQMATYQRLALPPGCEAVSASPGRAYTNTLPGTPQHPGAVPQLITVIVTCRNGQVVMGLLGEATTPLQQ
jgi:hypothetical protein